MTARAYVRVSSHRQAAEGLSLDVQVERLRAAAPPGDFAVYREEGVSGRKAWRPELERLLADVQHGDTILVVALDRLGRSLTHVIETVKLIGERGGQLVSLRESIDTSSPTGRFMFAIVGAFAELESGLIGERVRATRSAAKRKHGKYFGGLRRLGREPDGSIRHSEAKIVREIVHRFLQGVPVRAIARDLQAEGVPTASGGTWRGTGVTRMLKRPDLAGLVEVEGELVPGSLEPIISRETWERVRAQFADRATGVDTRGRHPSAPYLLDRPLDARCGICGGRLRPRTVHRKGRPTLYRYVCISQDGRGVCAMSRFPRETVDSHLVALFSRDLLDEKATLKAIESAARAVLADAEKALREAEREASRADERLARVRRDYSDGGLTLAEWRSFADEITSEQKAALAEVERLRRHVAELEKDGPIHDAQRKLLELMDDMRRLADRYEPGEEGLVQSLTTAMARIVERIVVHPLSEPDQAGSRPDSGRSVFIVGERHLLEIVARETSPQLVELANGIFVDADLPRFERAALDRAENGPITSVMGDLTVRVLEKLASS